VDIIVPGVRAPVLLTTFSTCSKKV